MCVRAASLLQSWERWWDLLDKIQLKLNCRIRSMRSMPIKTAPSTSPSSWIWWHGKWRWLKHCISPKRTLRPCVSFAIPMTINIAFHFKLRFFAFGIVHLNRVCFSDSNANWTNETHSIIGFSSLELTFNCIDTFGDFGLLILTWRIQIRRRNLRKLSKFSIRIRTALFLKPR